MSVMYALTSKQRDGDSKFKKVSADAKKAERDQAFRTMKEEIRKAEEAKEDSGWLGVVTKALDSAMDAVVGGNPLQDIAQALDGVLDTKVFEVAYDFVRPDALLNGAMMLTSAALDKPEIAQGYDIVSGTSSVRTRFQGAADVSGQSEVMDVYAGYRETMAGAMVTVGTCGTGAVAIAAMAASAAMMVESKLDLLGKAGVKGEAAMWTRIGGQAVIALGTGLSKVAGAGLGMVDGTASAAVQIGKGVDDTARGAVKVGQAIYDNVAENHMINASSAENKQHKLDREQERIITGLRAISQSYQRTLSTIASTMQEHGQTQLTLARSIA